jgi:hypothetical protein
MSAAGAAAGLSLSSNWQSLDIYTKITALNMESFPYKFLTTWHVNQKLCPQSPSTVLTCRPTPLLLSKLKLKFHDGEIRNEWQSNSKNSRIIQIASESGTWDDIITGCVVQYSHRHKHQSKAWAILHGGFSCPSCAFVIAGWLDRRILCAPMTEE